MYAFVHEFAVKFAALCNSIPRWFGDCLYSIRTNVAIYVLSLTSLLSQLVPRCPRKQTKTEENSRHIKTIIYGVDARRILDPSSFPPLNGFSINPGQPRWASDIFKYERILSQSIAYIAGWYTAPIFWVCSCIQHLLEAIILLYCQLLFVDNTFDGVGNKSIQTVFEMGIVHKISLSTRHTLFLILFRTSAAAILHCWCTELRQQDFGVACYRYWIIAQGLSANNPHQPRNWS